jgi:hypothetical protein
MIKTGLDKSSWLNETTSTNYSFFTSITIKIILLFFLKSEILSNDTFICMGLKMPVILINQTKIECSLILFDLDGSLINKKFRNKMLAETRMNAIRRLVDDDAALLWAKLSGVDPKTLDVDDREPLSKAAKKDDITVAATAIWFNRMSWFKAKDLATEAYALADLEQSRNYRPFFVRWNRERFK